MNAFVKPGEPSAGIQWDDHNDALLVVQPRSLEKVSTRYGQSDAVKARVSVIDGSGTPADYPDTLIFPKLLLAQTRDKLGEKVLGRLGKGVAKPGQDAPWVLNEPSENDYQIAEE
jgi:hypothetical protein